MANSSQIMTHGCQLHKSTLAFNMKHASGDSSASGLDIMCYITETRFYEFTTPIKNSTTIEMKTFFTISIVLPLNITLLFSLQEGEEDLLS